MLRDKNPQNLRPGVPVQYFFKRLHKNAGRGLAGGGNFCTAIQLCEKLLGGQVNAVPVLLPIDGNGKRDNGYPQAFSLCGGKVACAVCDNCQHIVRS